MASSEMNSKANEGAEHIEMSDSSKDPEDGPGIEYSLDEQRKIRRKVDFRIILPLGLMLAVGFLDRGNAGNAAIAGMTEDLHLEKGSRYSVILLVFFITYVIFQMPTTVVVRKIGPKIFLPTITLLWGVVMMCFGFVHDWKVMVVLRLLLGITEAGLFPGAVYTISQWYTRYEIHKRYSLFYVISISGAAFSGLLAYVFSQMKGLGNLNAWRWIFIMEGLLTCTISFISFALLANLPSDAHKTWKFLTKRETDCVIQRMEEDRQESDEEEPFQLKKFLAPAADFKIWGFNFIYLCMCIVVYAIGFFMPIILSKQLKFDLVEAQALSTPPYVFGCLQMSAQGWLGDKFHLRSPIVVFNSLQAMAGICILAWATVPGVQYFGMFFVTAGSHSNLPAIITWQANNIRGRWKHSFCSAAIIGSGGVGGIIGSLVFRAQDAPRYLPGLYACIVCCVLTIIISAAMVFYFRWVNKRAAGGNRVIEDLEDFYYTL